MPGSGMQLKRIAALTSGVVFQHLQKKCVQFYKWGRRAVEFAHRTSTIPMQRYEIGDRVVVLPRFAHLYGTATGVVVAVKLDPFRPAFNEYKIEFADGSTASLFEFQLAKPDRK